MKFLFSVVFLAAARPALADTFILKDGARLDGEVVSEAGDALTVQTRYGALTINKTDIQERKGLEPVPAPAAVPAVSSMPAVSATEPALAVSSAQPRAAEPPAPGLTFVTVTSSTASSRLVYMESGVVIATETFNAAGVLVSMDGAAKDGTYTEYYPDGGLKTVKTMQAGKASGTLKAFYPGGKTQIEAYYLGGVKEGTFKFFSEDNRLLMEAEYRGDRLNGWKKEYGPDGASTAQTYYVDDQPAEPPLAAQRPEKASETAQGSKITAKTMRVARGERFSFQLNGKYVGKLHLDKEFNLISSGGKIPDGVIKVYTKDGRLEKELVFEHNELRALRDYQPGGPLKAEYAYEKDKAVKQPVSPSR